MTVHLVHPLSSRLALCGNLSAAFEGEVDCTKCLVLSRDERLLEVERNKVCPTCLLKVFIRKKGDVYVAARHHSAGVHGIECPLKDKCVHFKCKGVGLEVIEVSDYQRNMS